MSTEFKSVKGTRTPDDVRKRIAAEDPAISTSNLAAKYGVSIATIYLIRKEAGIISTAKGAHKSDARLPRKPDAVAEQRERTSLVLAAHGPDRESVTIPVKVNHRLLDSWFSHLSLETKAQLFAGNYAIRVEGSVQ